MTYNLNKHHRRSLRLKGYDYSKPGAYFITIVSQERACLFGDVVDGEMQLNGAGRMVYAEWESLPDRFPGIMLDAFVVMPNHIHGIIVIVGDPVGVGLVPAQNTRPTTNRATTRVAPTVGDVVGVFKSGTTVLYTHGVKQCGWPPFPGRL
ncbi:MAG: hypothetical protein WHS38_06650 [Thermodesulforhabdaceae bacterium]